MPLEIRYSEWKKEHRKTLELFKEKRIFISFSGGKDSSLALFLISEAAREFGFEFETHTGTFPVHRYPPPERERIESYWNAQGIPILWHDFFETDEEIQNAHNPCHACQKIRKRLLKKIVSEKVDDLSSLILVICFGLWDLVGYSLEHILGDLFHEANGREEQGKSQRFMETAQRFYPVMTMKEGYTVFRPILRYNGSDILYTLGKKNIPFLSTPCRFRDYRPKRVLEKYYEEMGLRFDYKKVFNFAEQALDLPDLSVYTSIAKDRYLEEIF